MYHMDFFLQSVQMTENERILTNTFHTYVVMYLTTFMDVLT